MNFVVYLICACTMLAIINFPAKWFVDRYADENFEADWTRPYASLNWFLLSLYLGAAIFIFTITWNFVLNTPMVFETVYEMRTYFVQLSVWSVVFGAISSAASLGYYAYRLEAKEGEE